MYHALNRAARGETLFNHDLDYEAFEQVLVEALVIVPMRLLSYTVMPNHWHFLLWPAADGDLPAFMQWVTQTHTQRYHAAHGTVGSGAVYQGRYKSFPIQSDEHLLTVARYIERNPLRANLVQRAEDWPWGTLSRRLKADEEAKVLLSPWPVPPPQDWTTWVNVPLTGQELADIRSSVVRGRPYGRPSWQEHTARLLRLESTLRPRGRPRVRP